MLIIRDLNSQASVEIPSRTSSTTELSDKNSNLVLDLRVFSEQVPSVAPSPDSESELKLSLPLALTPSLVTLRPPLLPTLNPSMPPSLMLPPSPTDSHMVLTDTNLLPMPQLPTSSQSPTVSLTPLTDNPLPTDSLLLMDTPQHTDNQSHTEDMGDMLLSPHTEPSLLTAREHGD